MYLPGSLIGSEHGSSCLGTQDGSPPPPNAELRGKAGAFLKSLLLFYVSRFSFCQCDRWALILAAFTSLSSQASAVFFGLPREKWVTKFDFELMNFIVYIIYYGIIAVKKNVMLKTNKQTNKQQVNTFCYRLECRLVSSVMLESLSLSLSLSLEMNCVFVSSSKFWVNFCWFLQLSCWFTLLISCV